MSWNYVPTARICIYDNRRPIHFDTKFGLQRSYDQVSIALMQTDAHILVVDDNKEMRELVSGLLESDHFRVSTAADGGEMRDVLAAHAVDLIVLDLMLPGQDGLTLCRNLREASCFVPVVILTAKGDEIDRIIGLEVGADDYVAKPFSGRELVARVKAVLRRSKPQAVELSAPDERTYEFNGWRLDVAKRLLESSDDVVVPLSTGEYNLLLAFVQRPQRVLNRDQLLDLTKGRSATPFDRSIDLQVSRLRRKLRDDPKNPTIIKTVWGGGYVFTPKVVWR
jgi:two-component system, OmpR family, response regulator